MSVIGAKRDTSTSQSTTKFNNYNRKLSVFTYSKKLSREVEVTEKLLIS